MVINLYKAKERKIYDITEMISSVEWGGDVLAAARTSDLSVVNAPYDSHIGTLPAASPGDFIGIELEEEIFYGQVYGIEKTSEDGTVTWNCADQLQHLLKSYAKYNFKNTTAEAITAQVCADFQFPVGSLAQTGILIPTMICDNNMIYDIIMGAYTKAWKQSGKLYQCRMENRALCVIEKGQMLAGGFVLAENMNITKTSYKESTESVINRVKIYNENGQQVGEVTDTESAEKYGIFQETYTVEEGIQPAAGAGMLMNGPEQTLTVEAVGDINCIAGRGVKVQDSATGMAGLYWIKSDRHIFQNGIHTMSLELQFKNIMDEKKTE